MRFKIIIVNAGIVVLATILTYVLLMSSLKGVVSDPKERKGEVERSLRAASSQLTLDALKLERWLEGNVSTESIKAALGMPTPEARQQAALVEANRLREAAQSDPRFARMTPSLVALVDADGVVASRDGSNLMRGEKLAEAYPALAEALKTGRAGSSVWINRQRQEQLLASYAPVRGENGSVIGAIIVGTPLNDERISRTSELTSGTSLIFASVYDKGVEIVADSADTTSAIATAASTAPVSAAARAALSTGNFANAEGVLEKSLFGAIPLDGYAGNAAVLIAAVPAERVDGWMSVLWPVLAVGALALFLVGLGGVLVGNYMSQPISELEDGLLAIINGQSDLRFQIEHDVLGGLVFRINSLLNAMTGVPEDTTDEQGRPSKAPSAADFQEPG
jgi:tetratricopeptide (TPR) repeat protein